ncbi:MAG: DUF749 family protein [Candidatus Hydrothermarchaeales archaeon]
MDKKFVAAFLDIKDINKVPEDIAPYVNFKIAYEGREIKGDEKVAIFNIADTSSYAVVFLDPGKSIEDIAEEVKRESYAVLQPEGRDIIKRALR